ncbi:MAG: hypothetical protein ACREBU_06315 [Nitrososphaera sp.]
MPAGRFTLFRKGVRYIAQSNIDLDATNLWAAPLHRGYTPNTASHSAYTQISAFLASAGGTALALRQLSSLNVSTTGANSVKHTASNIAGFSRGGSLFQCKRVTLFASASIGGIDNPLIGFLDVDPDLTTGVEAMQVDVQWPSSVTFKLDANP